MAPYPLSFVALIGFLSLLPMHALPTPYEILVTCHHLSGIDSPNEMALPLAASPVSENLQNIFLFCLTISLTLEAALSCEGAVTLAMLKNAAYNSNRHNSYSCDGLQLEFYIAFFPLLHNDFLLMANSLPHLDTLTTRQHIITCIPKDGDLTSLTNWRPISVLNADHLQN